MKCKSNLIKNKTITAGENFVKGTKDYQKKEWSEEKSKVDDVKKKIAENSEPFIPIHFTVLTNKKRNENML